MREIAGIPDLILSEDAAITMQGILRSAAELVSAVLEQCLKTWAIRREQTRSSSSAQQCDTCAIGTVRRVRSGID